MLVSSELRNPCRWVDRTEKKLGSGSEKKEGFNIHEKIKATFHCLISSKARRILSSEEINGLIPT